MSSLCMAPFLNAKDFPHSEGLVSGRVCAQISNETSCCLPCPMTQWFYPDSFDTMGLAAEVVAVVSTALCLFLLLSWAFLPVEKTYRHYLSICLTLGVTLMNLGFVIPLAAKPEQCSDAITPHDMRSSSTCAASGSFIVLGGWAGVMWVFLRSLSLHLQICWQVVVGQTFMWFAFAVGWGVPIVGLILALTLSGVSFRFGATCHINHENSLADLWIPLLIFAGFTILIQFATFGYCIKVYLASLADSSASTEGSNLPSYTNSVQSISPRQAYRRVRRVIALQWRGITIVLLIIADVIFFSIVFVFQDNVMERTKSDRSLIIPWVSCLVAARGDKNKCLGLASGFVVNQATAGAVLVLLAMNGIWMLIFLGRGSMVTGWIELFTSRKERHNKAEFVSADARMDDLKSNTTRSYEMLSRDSGKTMVDDTVTPSAGTPISPAPARTAMSPAPSGRRTPDYFGATARYHTPARSFSSPRPPSSSLPQQQRQQQHPMSSVHWDPSSMYTKSTTEEEGSESSHDIIHDGSLGGYHTDVRGGSDNQRGMNPLEMNRI